MRACRSPSQHSSGLIVLPDVASLPQPRRAAQRKASSRARLAHFLCSNSSTCHHPTRESLKPCAVAPPIPKAQASRSTPRLWPATPAKTTPPTHPPVGASCPMSQHCFLIHGAMPKAPAPPGPQSATPPHPTPPTRGRVLPHVTVGDEPHVRVLGANGPEKGEVVVQVHPLAAVLGRGGGSGGGWGGGQWARQVGRVLFCSFV